MLRILICAICGYQWDDDSETSTFYMDCPVCDANKVNVFAPEIKDGDPWY